jgi:hypothetical protein
VIGRLSARTGQQCLVVITPEWGGGSGVAPAGPGEPVNRPDAGRPGRRRHVARSGSSREGRGGRPRSISRSPIGGPTRTSLPFVPPLSPPAHRLRARSPPRPTIRPGVRGGLRRTRDSITPESINLAGERQGDFDQPLAGAVIMYGSDASWPGLPLKGRCRRRPLASSEPAFLPAASLLPRNLVASPSESGGSRAAGRRTGITADRPSNGAAGGLSRH